MKAGRKTKYKPEFNKQAYKLALLGATDKELADFFEITEQTLNNWKNEKEGFFESIKNGKIKADAEVSEKLLNRALGYSHPETKVFNNQGEIVTYEVTKHYPPDTAAAFIWLKNRQPDKWRDKIEPKTDDTKQVTKVKLPDGTIIEV